MTITNSSLRLVSLVTGVAVAIALMSAVAVAPAKAAGLTQTQISSIVSLLASFGADQATINNVTAALNGQATTGTGTGTGSNPNAGTCPALTRDIQQGSSGADVKSFQVFLNSMADTKVAASGAGSPGNETMTFGPATKAAAMKLQAKLGVTPVAGYIGAKSRAAIAATCGNTTPGTGTGTGTTGGSVTVSAGAQPVNSLAPAGASRVPFTTFTLTNNSSAAVTVNGVTVQRTGLGVDANFSGIVLLDSNGLQVGTAKTLNSNHQATIGDTFTIPAHASMTYTVAGNIATGQTTSGQVISLQVVAVNTGATVSGSLPISGASQTINTTLSLGSVSTSTSSYDPGSATNKNIGDTGVRFSGVRFTASSAEDLKLYSIRWRQVGTAASSDISNVMTYVDATSYPTTLSADGKYYTTVFPGGITIPKGQSVDVYVQGDLTGSNSTSRTVRFDIDRVTDVYFVGQTYGYGVAASGTFTPWYAGYSATIQAGSVTTIGKANEVAAQNIAVNVPNQPLGGFVTNFSGEPVSITGMTVTFSTSTAATGLLTSVSLVNANGTVVAGPVDATMVSGQSSVSFTDTVTFPVGRQVYTLKGKVPSGATGGAVITAATVPSSWSNPTGQTTGSSITISTGTFNMNAMTVKAASLTITASVQPAAQNIVAGVQNALLGRVQLDASQSGEDLRLSSIILRSTDTSGSFTSFLSGCQLYNGTTALNTGSRVVNSLTTATNATVSLDNPLVVPKGTVVTLDLKCNVSSSASGAGQIGVNGGSWSVTGVTSGTSVTPTVTTGNSGVQTIATGSFTGSVDTAVSPARTMVAGGSTGVTVGAVKFRASNEDVNLTKVGLSLAGGWYGTKSNANGGTTNGGVSDVLRVYIYDGATLVGQATFTGTTATATSTLSTAVTLPKNTDKTLTLKADLNAIGDGQGGGIGDVVTINPLNAEGTGAASGSTLSISASGTVGGVQMFKSYPTVAAVSGSGTNPNGTDVVLKKFTVTANAAGSIGIAQMAFTLATSSANVTSAKLFGYTDSGYSNPIGSGGGTNGQVGSTLGSSGFASNSPTITFVTASTTPVQIGAGQTVYFALKGTVTPTASASNWSVNATLLGSSAVLVATSTGYNASPTVSTAFTANDFIWSGNSSTTAVGADIDWWNGYFVPGLSSSGI